MDEKTLSTVLCGIDLDDIIEAFDQLAEAFAKVAEAFTEACAGVADIMKDLADYAEDLAEFPPERETEETVYILPRLPVRRAPPAKVKRWRAAVYGHYLGEREIRVKGGETA